MELSVKNASTVQVSKIVFGAAFNESLIHQTIVSFMAGARQGTRAQKTRSEVSGGGRKPWRQKGTGRARAGSIRSPVWRGGGRSFAAKPQDHTKKLNKKMYRGALRSILSELIRKNRLIIVESLIVDTLKTNAMLAKLKTLTVEKSLIVSDAVDRNLYLATRNIPHIDVCDVEGIDPVSLIVHEKVLMTLKAIRKCEEVFG